MGEVGVFSTTQTSILRNPNDHKSLITTGTCISSCCNMMNFAMSCRRHILKFPKPSSRFLTQGFQNAGFPELKVSRSQGFPCDCQLWNPTMSHTAANHEAHTAANYQTRPAIRLASRFFAKRRCNKAYKAINKSKNNKTNSSINS